MLTRIRNANIARHEMVEIPGSHMKWSMAEILKTEGFVRDCEFVRTTSRGSSRSAKCRPIKSVFCPVSNVLAGLGSSIRGPAGYT